MSYIKRVCISTFILSCPNVVIADHGEQGEDGYVLEEVYVTGGAEAIKTMAGSATFIDDQAIEKYDVSDINNLLTQVPGVYIRLEDGYGLRPNIGLRGATSDRSQKVTLMEDGILIAPSPYSAPAAYYLPNVNRMDAVEVFKGPASIHFGPHTVGGALNLVTKAIPLDSTAEFSSTFGSNNYQKYRAFYGDTIGNIGFWVDFLRYGADGFKELGELDTGFVRNDINAKLRWQSDADAQYPQKLELKLGFADEESDETYLGLTDEDFEQNPLQRYVASEEDKFTSEHTQLHAIYTLGVNDSLSLTSKAYVNRFDRSWNKFNGFMGGECQDYDAEAERYACPLAAADVLSAPEVYQREIALLRGEVDSNGGITEALDVTDNAREYGSHGLELSMSKSLESGEWQHDIDVGFRFHHDYVEREHLIQAFNVLNAQLVENTSIDSSFRDLNEANTDALAVYISDEINYKKWKFNLGLRFEDIQGEYIDKRDDALNAESEQSVVIPGLGAFYQWSDSVGVLLGINKGFSPNSPSPQLNTDETVETDPEESINYEFGVRFEKHGLNADAILFFSDYSNLLGRCRASDVDCTIGQEFNGGNVEIGGLEFTSQYAFEINESLSMPLSLTYTYTESAFQTAFPSNFSQWGNVYRGDELPYTPDHQGRLQFGLEASNWDANLSLRYTGDMREKPSAGALIDGEYIEGFSVLDMSGSYHFESGLSAQLIVENLLDEQVIVSRRPFGARPNMPRVVKFGLRYSL